MGNQNARIQNVLEENVVLLVVLAIIINLVIKNLRHAVVLIVHEVNVVVINRDVLRGVLLLEEVTTIGRKNDVMVEGVEHNVVNLFLIGGVTDVIARELDIIILKPNKLNNSFFI